MKLLAIIFALGIQGSFGSEEASFRWLEERSADGIPHLAITYADGTMDHAILERYNPIPQELDETKSPVGSCLFRGYLASEENSMVVVSGCAGEDSFQVATSSQKKNLWLSVEKGIGRAIKNTFSKEALYAPEIQEKVESISTERATYPATGYIFNLAVYYDPNWVKKYTNTPLTPVDAIRVVVGFAQLIYNWPSLGAPVTLNVASLTIKTDTISSDENGLNVLATYPVNDAVINTRVGFTTVGSSGGIAYVGVVCLGLANTKFKTAVVSGGDWSEQSTAEIMAHELGHNLGMPHDFTDPFASPKTPRFDSKGVKCTDANGVMDYFVTVKVWSTCSKEAWLNYFNKVANANSGKFCMAVASKVNGQWSNWSGWGSPWGTCSRVCGGGTQTRNRWCVNPAPSAGGANCPAATTTESQACNTPACTNNNWGGSPLYLCSNQLSRTVSCPSGKLHVYGAGLLRKSATICPAPVASQNANTNCFAADATAKIAALCEGKASCTISLPTGLGDACGTATNKYLQVNLDCSGK